MDTDLTKTSSPLEVYGSRKVEPSDATLHFREGNSSMTFNTRNSVEVLRLDDKGMTYKGVLIEDAGEAHRIFLRVMRKLEAEV